MVIDVGKAVDQKDYVNIKTLAENMMYSATNVGAIGMYNTMYFFLEYSTF